MKYLLEEGEVPARCRIKRGGAYQSSVTAGLKSAFEGGQRFALGEEAVPGEVFFDYCFQGVTYLPETGEFPVYCQIKRREACRSFVTVDLENACEGVQRFSLEEEAVLGEVFFDYCFQEEKYLLKIREFPAYCQIKRVEVGLENACEVGQRFALEWGAVPGEVFLDYCFQEEKYLPKAGEFPPYC